MKNRVVLIFILFLLSCKPYYNSNKKYFDNETLLIDKSKSLDFITPVKINFAGTLNDNSKEYKVSGFFKIESIAHYQIFLYSKTFGVEICRVDINLNQITFIDKINKLYYKGSIDNFKYFKTIKLNGDEFLRLLLGRIFVNANLHSTNNLMTYSYSNDYSKGQVVLNSFGYCFQHKIVASDFICDLSFSNFSISSSLPSAVIGNLIVKEVEFKFDLNFLSVSTDKFLLDEFVVHDNFKQIL